MFSVEHVDSFEQNLTKNMYHTELRFFFRKELLRSRHRYYRKFSMGLTVSRKR